MKVRIGTLVAPLAIFLMWSALPAEAEVRSHDQIVRLAESATTYDKTWNPSLYIENGCQSYPAVDAAGNTSGGLAPTGTENGNCTNADVGQAYARTKCWTSTSLKICATIYQWYFPKDMAMFGSIPINNAGHRHDWEGVVVWTRNDAFVGAAFSQHGNWARYNAGSSSLVFNSNGKTLRVKYARSSGTHAVMPTGQSGTTKQLVSWENLGSTVRTPLNSWTGDANFAARDSAYLTEMAESMPSSLCGNFPTNPLC
jgi:hypothetical protein